MDMSLISAPIVPAGTSLKSLLPVLGVTFAVVWMLGLGKYRKNPSRKRRGHRSRRR